MPEDLAVFIDWENIYISTVTEYKSRPNVSAILEKAREYGRIVAAFDLPEGFEAGEQQLLWVEAVLDEETLSQTVVRIHDRYSV